MNLVLLSNPLNFEILLMMITKKSGLHHRLGVESNSCASIELPVGLASNDVGSDARSLSMSLYHWNDIEEEEEEAAEYDDDNEEEV